MSTVASSVAAFQHALCGRAGLHHLAYPLRIAVPIRAAGAAAVHPSAAPVLLLALAIAFLAMAARINSELVSIFSQLIRTVAVIGRMLVLIVLIGVIAVLVMIHL